MTRRGMFKKSGMFYSALVAISVVSVGDAFAPPRPPRSAASTLTFATKNADYYARLQQAAKDPAAFELFVMSGGDNSTQTASRSSPPASQAKKGGYQRVEEWNDESGGFEWDQKVQFEGQKYGNQFKQNEILRHNLNSF